MKRLLVSCPTASELAPIEQLLNKMAGLPGPSGFRHFGSWQIMTHISGAGVPMVLLHLDRALDRYRPHLLLHAGIAGVQRESAEIGDAVEVLSDRYADIGAQDRDGGFLDMFHLNLWKDGDAPWSGGVFTQPNDWGLNRLPGMSAVTVHTMPGTHQSIRELANRYPFQIESMEGAAVFHVALERRVPFVAVRGISNYIQPRDKSAWNLPAALDATRRAATDFLDMLAAGSYDDLAMKE